MRQLFLKPASGPSGDLGSTVGDLDSVFGDPETVEVNIRQELKVINGLFWKFGDLKTVYGSVADPDPVGSRVCIIPSKNSSGRFLILRNSVLNAIPQNFMEFRNLIPLELKNSLKFRRNSTGHSSRIQSFNSPGSGSGFSPDP